MPDDVNLIMDGADELPASAALLPNFFIASH
jgi:hypothetical protein